MNIMPGGSEWILILIAFVLLFGAKRLPDTARSLGRSMRILKAETKGLREDDDAPAIEDPEAARERREFEEWKATRTDRSETR